VAASPSNLILPLLVGLAVDMKFVLTLLFPKAGTGGVVTKTRYDLIKNDLK